MIAAGGRLWVCQWVRFGASVRVCDAHAVHSTLGWWVELEEGGGWWGGRKLVLDGACHVRRGALSCVCVGQKLHTWAHHCEYVRV